MTFPSPVPDLVLRHVFLLSDEVALGQREAAEAQPRAIVIAAVQVERAAVFVTVAPITQSPPDGETAAVELPAKIALDLGLDDDRQRLRFNEFNYFDWSGFDLSPVPGTGGYFAYGMLTRPYFEWVKGACSGAGKRIAVFVETNEEAVKRSMQLLLTVLAQSACCDDARSGRVNAR